MRSVWVDMDLSTNTNKTHVQKKLDNECLWNLSTILHSIVNIIGRIYVFNEEINNMHFE